MKRLGIVARADAGGLASQSLEVCRHLDPELVLLVDLGSRGRGPSIPGRYANHDVIRSTGPRLEPRKVRQFLSGVDVVFSIETFYDGLVEEARARKVERVLSVNPELFRGALDQHADRYLLPTPWRADRLPVTAEVLPQPVSLDRFDARVPERTDPPTFVHVPAPAMLDRNGTEAVLEAVSLTREAFRLLITGPVSSGYDGTTWSAGERATVEMLPHTEREWWEVYPPEAEALILPRRYGGLSLPMLEAAAAGMAVVTTDLEPQRQWFPHESLVPCPSATPVGMRGGRFPVHTVDALVLAARLDELARDALLRYRLGKEARAWAEENSWERWLPAWQRALRG